MAKRKNYTGRKRRRILPVLLVVLLAGSLAFFAYSALSQSLFPPDIPVTDPNAPAEPEQPSEPESKVPESFQDGGIFSSEYERAYELLSEMTLEEKAGQVLLARCPEEDAAEAVREYHLGGLVLFGRDFKGLKKSTVVSNLASYQAAADIPLILSVDEEGGSVVRVSSNKNLAEAPFNSQRYLYKNGGISALVEDTKEKCELLASLGINLNLAPVADVSTDSDDYIYKRTIGKDAETTADCIEAIVKATKGTGVSATLKHFPGYGSNPDTHTGVAIDKRSLDSFRERDFLPFQAGIDAGAPCVLVSHNVVESMDDELPASLSPAVHERLREELGFTGLILTDDMAMDGVTAYTGSKSPYVMALLAGNDLITTSEIETPYEDILAAVKDGSLPEETLDRAVFRVLAFKLSAGILAE